MAEAWRGSLLLVRSDAVAAVSTFDLMLRGQGGLRPPPCGAEGGWRGHISLSCIDLHAGLTANLPSVWPSKAGCLFCGFPFLLSAGTAAGLHWTALLYLLPLLGHCSRLRVTVNLPPKARGGGGASADRWPVGSLDLQASGLSLVSPGGTNCQRQCQMPRCPDAPFCSCPCPSSYPFTGGQADQACSSRSCPPFCSATADYS